MQVKPQLVPAGESLQRPSDLDHEGQMSTAFQAEDTLWAKAQGGMDFVRRGEAGSTPMVMVSALFHACSIWLDEAINLPLFLRRFCLIFCWGSVCVEGIHFQLGLAAVKMSCLTDWELDDSHLPLRAGAVAALSDAPRCAGGPGGRRWLRAAGCPDLNIIWEPKACGPNWLINMAACPVLGVFSGENLGWRYRRLPRQRGTAYRRWVDIFLLKKLVPLCAWLFSSCFRALLKM